MKNNLYMTLGVLGITLLIIVGIVFFAGAGDTGDPETALSLNGLHWHPHLSIVVDGEEVRVSANIGLSPVRHSPIHTHEPDGVIHLEFGGHVTEDDIRLKRFFKVWNKDMDDFGILESMTVNGEENGELGEYVMQDADEIELRYESQ